MKTLKFILSSLVSLVIINTNAQESHIKCAPGCELANTLNGKNYVSCIDRVCPICHKKKETERKEQLESEKTEAQKRAQQAEQRKQKQTILIAEQKKQIAIQRQKAKENEVVLVAPTPKVEKNISVTLNSDDEIIKKMILDIQQYDNLIVGYCSGKQNSYWSLIYPNIKNSGKIILEKVIDGEAKQTIVKENFNIKSKFQFSSYFGGLHGQKAFAETGFFIVEFDNNKKNSDRRSYSELIEDSWFDLVDIQGNCVFNDQNIKNITYDPKMKQFLLTIKGENNPSKGYNPVNKTLSNIN